MISIDGMTMGEGVERCENMDLRHIIIHIIYKHKFDLHVACLESWHVLISIDKC